MVIITRAAALRQKPSLKTTRLFTVLYRMVAIWRAMVDEGTIGSPERYDWLSGPIQTRAAMAAARLKYCACR
jgi:hypothetical protein